MFARMRNYGQPDIPKVPAIVYAVRPDGSILTLRTHECLVYPDDATEPCIRCTSDTIWFNLSCSQSSVAYEWYIYACDFGQTVFFDYDAAISAAKETVEKNVMESNNAE